MICRSPLAPTFAGTEDPRIVHECDHERDHERDLANLTVTGIYAQTYRPENKSVSTLLSELMPESLLKNEP